MLLDLRTAVRCSRACLSIGKLLRLRYSGSIQYLSSMLHLKLLAVNQLRYLHLKEMTFVLPDAVVLTFEL